MAPKIIVIKVGTNVIVDENGLRKDILANLVSQIASLKNLGYAPVLISSGAVGAGRLLLNMHSKSKIIERQVLSSIGQSHLIEVYRGLFATHKILVAQVLLTKEDLKSRQHYLNIHNCLDALLQQGIVPIINENDTVSIESVMFTDNDHLASLLASMLNAEKMCFLTTVTGILKYPEESLIPIIDANSPEPKDLTFSGGSSFGRGGMSSKYKMAFTLAKMGIQVYIMNGQEENIVLKVLAGKAPCTAFINRKGISKIKRWLAYQDGVIAQVYLDPGAVSKLSGVGQAKSLLPIGIIKINGSFAKGDLIKLRDIEHREIGIGIAEYSSDKAMDYMGQRAKPALAHCDHLYFY